MIRLLEEGKVSQAESEKQRLEQLQRTRLKQLSDKKIAHTPQWFT